MWLSRTSVFVGVLSASTLGASHQPVAEAAPQWGLNGTYLATSNGEWAKTNDIYHDETSIRSTWTIATTCSYPGECTGSVNSEFGWSAAIYQKSGVWYVKKMVNKWQPCPDGSAGPGLQVFRFYPATTDGSGMDPASTTLLGEDSTTGISGSCGSSKVVFITMPFKLVKTA
ncbi:Rv2253/PknI dimerization domain-containing protein [Mycobacterium sp. BMJ-28]